MNHGTVGGGRERAIRTSVKKAVVEGGKRMGRDRISLTVGQPASWDQ